MSILRDFAFARSGDKGSSSNIGVIAKTAKDYQIIKKYLTADKVQDFFKPMGALETIRYELDNLECLNFVIKGVLQGGASLSLRSDSQGKGYGVMLLEINL